MEWSITDWLIFAAAIVLISAVIGWKFSAALAFRLRHVETEGTITNWVTMQEKGKQYFYPLISFTTGEGNTINYRAEERCENEPMYPRGTIVRVKYLPRSPKTTKTIYPNQSIG